MSLPRCPFCSCHNVLDKLQKHRSTETLYFSFIVCHRKSVFQRICYKHVTKMCYTNIKKYGILSFFGVTLPGKTGHQIINVAKSSETRFCRLKLTLILNSDLKYLKTVSTSETLSLVCHGNRVFGNNGYMHFEKKSFIFTVYIV